MPLTLEKIVDTVKGLACFPFRRRRRALLTVCTSAPSAVAAVPRLGTDGQELPALAWCRPPPGPPTWQYLCRTQLWLHRDRPLFHFRTATGPAACTARQASSTQLPISCALPVPASAAARQLQGMPLACLASSPRAQITRSAPATAGRVPARRFSVCRAMSTKEAMHGHCVASLGEALYGEAAQGAARRLPAAVRQVPPGRRWPHLTLCTSGPLSADCLADQLGKSKEEVTSW